MGYVSWRPIDSHNEESLKELFIAEKVDGPWVHYSQHKLKVPDYNIPGGSKGYATMQQLLKLGWQMVSY